LIFNFQTFDLGSFFTLTGALLGAECLVPGFSILAFAEAENASIPTNVRCLA